MSEPGSGIPGGREGSSGSSSPEATIVLSSRASVSRNLSNYKFPASCSTEEKNHIINTIKNYARRTRGLSEFCFLRLSGMTKIRRQVLLGDYQIDEDFISNILGRGILLIPRHSVMETATAVLLCWDDHIKIQSAAPHRAIGAVYSKVSEIEKLLESKLNFSFSKEWGYLTSNPAELGTALEISLLVHLPALSITPDIAEFIKNLSKVGCAVSGYDGRNAEVTGNIFRISSSRTLGKSEEEIVEEMNAICLNIVDEEEDARTRLLEKDMLGARDNVYRSYGLLKYASILSFEEALELLSILRLGLELGIIDNIKDFDYFEIINMIGDSHIISGYEMGEDATDDDIDLKRAEFIRDRILED